MRTISSKFSGADVPLLSTMLNVQSAQGDSSANPADTDPTPSSSLPQTQTTVSLDRTPVHSTEDAQAHTLLTHSLLAQPEHRAPVFGDVDPSLHQYDFFVGGPWSCFPPARTRWGGGASLESVESSSNCPTLGAN
ncbi:hypothetical protein L1987_55563 [Smallanthus sonchifolius]|uniref:Uncharacterized protein n=1 Tax=Smallanthus sonchifolius TaxID=185202 RepID=A0ACB9EBC1_9ASTR|nr:hypothetical protein L1987_55563 [Smallanthus sonchifolius]